MGADGQPILSLSRGMLLCGSYPDEPVGACGPAPWITTVPERSRNFLKWQVPA